MARRRVAARIQPYWRRLRHKVGHRGATLLFFAFVDFCYASSLWAPTAERQRSSLVAYLISVAPLRLWAMLWLIAGLVATVTAFRTEDRLGFTTCIALKTIWAVTLIFAALKGVDGAYVSVAIWVGAALFLFNAAAWPEPPAGPDVVAGVT